MNRLPLSRLKVAALVTVLCVPAALPAWAQGGQMPPAAVSVLTLKPEAVPLTSDLPGRIAPTRIAEVRPRVSGILEERVFQQGGMVKEGDVLYKIDPVPFRVKVASARAALQRAVASQQLARQQMERQQQLRQRNISSQQELDTATATLAQADADVASAQANLDEANLNLGYTSVKAPISGKIGRALITEGALVSATGSESLATIQQLDPVYADFTQSSNDMLRLKRALESGELSSPAPGEASVEIVLDDGTPYPEKARLLFSESAVDATTGQVTMRSEVPNPRGDLLPGMYVRVRIEQAVRQAALAVPQKAVVRDGQGGAQVYVVNEENKAVLTPITLGPVSGDRWVVQSGLKAGERIVVEGLQKVQPGATVQPEEPEAAKKSPAPSDNTPASEAEQGKAP